MVAPIYTNKKGIYKDLYREIDSDNKKKDATLTRKPRKGIYVELYKQIEFKNNENKEKQNNIYILTIKKIINDLASKVSFILSSATGEVKMLIVALMVVKRPINSYIESNLDIYSTPEPTQGIYYNEQ